MKTWADKISDLEARGWSLAGLGRAIELSPQSLSDIKQGRSTEPRGMAAVRLHHLHSTGACPPGKPANDTPEDTPPARRSKAAEGGAAITQLDEAA